MSAPLDSLVSKGYQTSPGISRKWFKLACVLLAGVSLFLLLNFSKWTSESQVNRQLPIEVTGPLHTDPESKISVGEQPPKANVVVDIDVLDPLSVLNGPPTERFRGEYSHSPSAREVY
jgi:hypothetical protein